MEDVFRIAVVAVNVEEIAWRFDGTRCNCKMNGLAALLPSPEFFSLEELPLLDLCRHLKSPSLHLLVDAAQTIALMGMLI